MSGQAETATVTVWPLSGVGRELAYRTADGEGAGILVGSLVRIPLGRRVELGVVVALGDDGSCERERMKALYGVEQPFPVVREDGIRLARWMAGYYSCGIEQVLEVMIPRAVRKGMQPKKDRRIRLARDLEAGELERLRRRGC
jgi:primosomal protein N' (replication factor Y)